MNQAHTDETQPEVISFRELLAPPYLSRIALLSLALWLHASNSLLTTTTLPSAINEIGGLHLISWAFSLYLLGSIIAASSVSLVVAIVGLRRAFLYSALAFGIGCAICAMTPSMEILLIARVIQGLGGGALMALIFISNDRFFPNHFIPRLVACFSATWSVAAFCGPLIGGAFATAGLWRMAFWVFCIQAIVLIITVAVLLEDDEEELENPGPIPIVRLSFLALAIISIAVAGADVQFTRSAILLVFGASCLAFFLIRDRRATLGRMFPLETTNLRHPIGSGITMTFILSMSMMSFLVYGPLVLIQLYDLSPLSSGFVLLTESLSWGLAAILFSGSPPDREPAVIRLGSSLVFSGLVLMALFLPNGPLWWVVICATISGSGFGMMWGFVIRRIADATHQEERDRVSGLIPSVQQLGFALGAALSGLIANGLNISDDMPADDLRFVTFWLFAGLAPLAFLGVIMAWRFARPHADAAGPLKSAP